MIKIKLTKSVPQENLVWCLPFYEDEQSSAIPPLMKAALARKPHESVVEVVMAEKERILRFINVRLGNKAQATQRAREEVGALMFKKAAEGSDCSLLLDIRSIGEEGLDLIMGALLSAWRFDRYRTTLKSGERNCIEEILVLCQDPTQLQPRLDRLTAIVEGVYYARNLTSEPSNIYYPMAYAEKLKELTALGIKVEILDESALQAIGMTALLAAGQGSGYPSCVVILHWNGTTTDKAPIVIAGKGVCFDSGGLCLKPGAQQPQMQWDNAGAGVVAGVLKTIALAKMPVNVIGILGMVENMPDGKAVKPGDVITTMSGQTIEIVNTDAEGRLVLADCLWYAQDKYKPSVTIDLGTLTPETICSLGEAYAGLYSNDPKLTQQLKNAGDKTGDLLWELPMGPYFAKQIQSNIADMKNLGVEFSGENGAAAEFLKRFIRNVSWGHLDIAGVSWTKEELPLSPKGVTGFGVRLLEEWLSTR